MKIFFYEFWLLLILHNFGANFKMQCLKMCESARGAWIGSGFSGHLELSSLRDTFPFAAGRRARDE